MQVRFYDGDDEIIQEIIEEDFWKKLPGDRHLLFKEEVSGETINIRLPLGTWDIMDALVPKILKYQPGDIVEVGMGESSQIFADHAYQKNTMLYSCDIQMGGMFKVFNEKLFENHICYIGRSEDFIKEYDGFPSIVFLDGEHRYEAVKREVGFFLPRLLSGGVMFLHDTYPPHERHIEPDDRGWSPGDVYKVRQELERNPEVDVFTWPYSAQNMGLTMVMKHQKDRPYWQKNGRGVNEVN